MADSSASLVPPIIISLLGEKTSGRILYMEAGKDFTDLLLSLLLLPASTTFGLLFNNGMVKEGHTMPGITNLYSSLLKLQDHYLLEEKEDLISPKLQFTGSSQNMFRLINTTTVRNDNASTVVNPHKYYRCSYSNRHRGHVCCNRISTAHNSACINCGSGTMSEEVTLVDDVSTVINVNAGSYTKGFVKETVTFIVTDNLEMFPASTIKTFSLLNRLKVCKLEDLESLDVEVDGKKALEIVRASYSSKRVLNEVFGKTFKSKFSEIGN